MPCRPIDDDNECDLPEHCQGDGQECPADLFRFNGAECQNKNKAITLNIC
jgi:hypothetical protein